MRFNTFFLLFTLTLAFSCARQPAFAQLPPVLQQAVGNLIGTPRQFSEGTPERRVTRTIRGGTITFGYLPSDGVNCNSGARTGGSTYIIRRSPLQRDGTRRTDHESCAAAAAAHSQFGRYTPDEYTLDDLPDGTEHCLGHRSGTATAHYTDRASCEAAGYTWGPQTHPTERGTDYCRATVQLPLPTGVDLSSGRPSSDAVYGRVCHASITRPDQTVVDVTPAIRGVETAPGTGIYEIIDLGVKHLVPLLIALVVLTVGGAAVAGWVARIQREGRARAEAAAAPGIDEMTSEQRRAEWAAAREEYNRAPVDERLLAQIGEGKAAPAAARAQAAVDAEARAQAKREADKRDFAEAVGAARAREDSSRRARRFEYSGSDAVDIDGGYELQEQRGA